MTRSRRAFISSTIAHKLWALTAIILGSALYEESLHGQVVAQRGVIRVKEGEVIYQRPPASAVPAGVSQQLDFGDQVQTAELSWAVVELTDVSQMRVTELSTLEIVKPSALAARIGVKLA